MNKQLTLISIAIVFSAIGFAQNVGIGTTSPNSNALLDVNSLNKGVLLPRMTASQRIAINPAASAKSLLVFDTDSSAFFYWTGAVWNKLSTAVSSAANYWNSNGTHLYNSNTGNVGIGTTIPEKGGLVVDKKAGAVNAMFGSNTTGVAIESSFPGIGFNSYFNGIRTNIATGHSGYIGVDPFAGGMQLLVSDASYAAGDAASYNVALNIHPDGKVGVGVTDAAYLLDVADRMRIRSKPGSSAGLWLNDDVNSASPAFIGMFDNNHVGMYGAGSNWAFRMNTQTGNVGIGDVNPNAPLQFANDTRNRKIVLWQLANNDHQYYGFGINAGTLRYQTPSANDDHVFFAGNGSASSSELARIKGNGYLGIGVSDPQFRLDVKDRIRLRSGGDNNTSAGIYFNNNANSSLASFVGMQTDNNVGFWGSGNGWGLTMNTQNGSLNINGSAGQAGQVLMSNGSSSSAAWTWPGAFLSTGESGFSIFNNLTGSGPHDFTNATFTINLATQARVLLFYKTTTQKICLAGNCSSKWRIETYNNGSITDTYYIDGNSYATGVGSEYRTTSVTSGPTFLTLSPGSYTFSFSGTNFFNEPTVSLQVSYIIINI